jgi:DNA polymerase-3 subunit delta'
MAFASVLGHERIKTLLARGVREGRLPPAILLVGPDGVGKKTLALAVARAVVCERRDGDACDACPACGRGSRGVHPDVFLLEAETAVIKVEQVRDLVREIAARPFEARARAFVIDEAQRLNEQAANALLKSLEEPPPTSHVFLVTAAPQGLLPTIRSRCQRLRCGPLPQALVEARLRELAGLAPEEARLRASLAGGSLGAALAFESETYRVLREELLGILETSAQAGVVDRMDAAQLLEESEDAQVTLTALRSLLRDVAVSRAGMPAEALQNADVAPRLIAIARGPLGEQAARFAQAAGETRAALQGNANKLLMFDLLLDTLAS